MKASPKPFVRPALVSAILVSLALLGLIVSGCAAQSNRSPSGSSTNPASGTTSEFLPGGSDSATARTASGVAYFLTSNKKLAPARVDAPVADSQATLKALLADPPADVKQAGYTSAIPSNTTLRSMSIEASTAVVDISREFETGGDAASLKARVAQVVFTLTRDPSVTMVSFRIDGKSVASLGKGGPDLSKPQSRATWEEFSPEILVESPVLGDTVSGDFKVTGTANVSDTTFRLEMQEPDGSVRTTQKVAVKSKPGTRGAFEATGTATYAVKGPGDLVAIEIPPMSPERIVRMTVPVTVE